MPQYIYSKAGADAAFVPNTEAGRAALAASPELGAAYVDRATAGVVGDEWRLTLAGTQEGGLDGADSTPRITIQSWQSPHGPNVGGFGQGIRLDVMHRFAKNLIVWRVPEDPTLPFDASSNPLQDVLWMGAHYNHYYPENPADTTNVHGHWSIEVPRADGALISRFGLRFINWTTKQIGTDHAMIDTYAADLVIRAYNAIDTTKTGVLRVAAETATFANRDKIVEFANDPAGGLKRWQIKALAGGSDALAFVGWRDDTVASGYSHAIFDRLTGKTAFGRDTVYGNGQFTLEWDAQNAGFVARPKTSPGTNAGFAARMTAATDRALSAALDADSSARLVVFADGKMEWGPGGSSARDVNLYRTSADVLATDDSLRVAGQLRFGASGDATIEYEQTGRVKATKDFTVTENLRIGSGQAGSGVGVIGVGNAATQPSGTPSGGFILWSSGGAPKWKTAGGVVGSLYPVSPIASPTANAASLKVAVDAIIAALVDLGKVTA